MTTTTATTSTATSTKNATATTTAATTMSAKRTLPLAHRMAHMEASAIREILKVAERPDILSFAGGLPAPELFPIDALADAHARVLAREGAAALQYSATEGFAGLRDWISARLRAAGMTCDVERTLITTGSQQGIDLAARVLLNPGDRVAVENPSYIAALQVFSGYEARFAAIASDGDGLQVDDLERQHAAEPVKLVYIVPNFQNPKGTTLSLARRHALVAFAGRNGVPILEDDPYGELRFEGTSLPPLAALDDVGVVIHLGTFSKTLAPGLRVAWAVGPSKVIRAMTVAKQSCDLHSSSLTQRALAALFERFDYEAHLTTLRRVYGERRTAMLAALDRYMPSGTRWTQPEGGMFTWVELPDRLRAEDIFEAALAQKVAFVPGSPFFAADKRYDTLRLNFSNRPPELIDEGMGRLGRVVERAGEGRRVNG
ncbi:MAG: PLP-dependent aminotransferase family protein [Ardenticatenales bacterium]|nr:PLP-dependent aminotransferase family protein [Ardenticatenales bacterium]